MRYKVGDTVRVRDWDDMVQQFDWNGHGIITIKKSQFTSSMRRFCGRKSIVSEVHMDSYSLKYFGNWLFTDDMLISAGTGKDKGVKIDLCKILCVKPDQVFYLSVLDSYDVDKDQYKVHENVLQRFSQYAREWGESHLEVNDLKQCKVIFYTATEDEKTILRNLDKKYRNWYVARDLCKELYIYEKLPKKRDEYYDSNDGLATRLLYSDLFQFIQFDTGAVPIKDIIGE